jgi:uncharacterized protein (TIGR02246 family)
MLPTVLVSLLTLALGFATPVGRGSTSPTSAQIDADYWSVIVASVVNDDIAAMGRTYHPEAVLVTAEGTRPIRDVLVGWGKDMAANKAKGTRATVVLRFATRHDDAETAFETGIFKYTLTDRAGKATPSYRRFEALLVKHDGKWRGVMERQLEATTEAAWDALPH